MRPRKSAPGQEGARFGKTDCTAESGELPVGVKIYHGIEAKSAAARIGVIDLLPKAVDLCIGATGAVGFLEPSRNSTWILATLTASRQWTAYESECRSCLANIEQRLFPNARSAWIDGGEKWN
jgi:hypothetical protein